MSPLEKAIEVCGGLTELANRIGATANQITNWRSRGVPLDWCVAIERATAQAVTCEELRPDRSEDFEYLRKSRNRRTLATRRVGARRAGEAQD